MKILIIEDEAQNARSLANMLLDIYPSCRICGPTASIADTVSYLQNNDTPDIILADIRLEDGLSFEVFRQVDVSSPIIFTSAYDEYALKAFKYNSMDYLLKPIAPDELRASLDKVAKYGNLNAELIRQMGKTFPEQYTYRERILVTTGNRQQSVKVTDIDYFYTENKVVRLYFKGTSRATRLTMSELEQQLDPALFFRASRQYIINRESVEYIKSALFSKATILLRGYPSLGISVSRAKAGQLKQWLGK